MRIITSGARYIDIDAYGGCIAYAELLNAQGIEARAATSSALNASIPQIVLDWKAPFDPNYKQATDDTFTVLDVSESEYFDPQIDMAKIDEVIDHHPGFESYWQERIGDKADIEFAGAVCTMIYERWMRAGLLDTMSAVSARLLICGILDNTLNFGADITTDRDREAHAALLKIAGLPSDWTAQYFDACEQAIKEDLPVAIRDDSKILTFAGQSQPFGVGQLIIWDAQAMLSQNTPVIEQVMPGITEPWFMNIIAISEKANYLLCADQKVQAWLEKLLDTTFDGDVARTSRLWLRKEIIKAAIDAEEKA